MLLEELSDMEDLKGLTTCSMVNRLLANDIVVRFETADETGKKMRGFVVSLKPNPRGRKGYPYEMRYHDVNERGEVDKGIDSTAISTYEMDNMSIEKDDDDTRILKIPNEHYEKSVKKGKK